MDDIVGPRPRASAPVDKLPTAVRAPTSTECSLPSAAASALTPAAGCGSGHLFRRHVRGGDGAGGADVGGDRCHEPAPGAAAAAASARLTTMPPLA